MASGSSVCEWLLSLSKQFLEPAVSQALDVDVEERGSRMAPELCLFYVHMVIYRRGTLMSF